MVYLYVSLGIKSRIPYIPIIEMIPAQVRGGKKTEEKRYEGRARQPAPTCRLGSCKKILDAHLLKWAYPNSVVRQSLDLGWGFQEIRDSSWQCCETNKNIFSVASVPEWRVSAGITHLLNSYLKNLNKWKKKKQIIHTCGCQQTEVSVPCQTHLGSLGGQLQCQRKIPLPASW